jgi:hypothetical protein
MGYEGKGTRMSLSFVLSSGFGRMGGGGSGSAGGDGGGGKEGGVVIGSCWICLRIMVRVPFIRLYWLLV